MYATNIDSLVKDNEIYEVDKLELYFLDYLMVPRAERVNLYFNMINQPLCLSDFDIKYGSFLLGYNIKFTKQKKIIGNEQILINYSTDVCFFYTEYRLVFLLDISQSLLIYDFNSQLMNIEKIEIYLKNIIKELLKFQKTIKTIKNEEILHIPKLILSFISMGTDEDCEVLSHDIYLDKSNYEDYFESVMKKLKHNLTEVNNCKKNKDNLSNFSLNNNNFMSNKNHSSYINKMLDQSLYILDLLPRSAAPILLILTDSNLSIAKLGNYNSILMQYNRVDISINIVDLYSTNREINYFALGFINNEDIMRFICRFTCGSYFNEAKLCQILNINMNKGTNKNILNFNQNEKKSQIGSNDNINTTNNNNSYKNSNNLKCNSCQNSIDILLCKKPYKFKGSASYFWVDNKILERISKSFDEIGFNFTSIDGFKLANGMKIFQKETFETYKLSIPLQRITESRIRESFQMIKSNYKRSMKNIIKYEISVLPEISISYIVKGKNERMINWHNQEEKNIKIKIKAPFYILNHLKLEYIRNRGAIEKYQNSLIKNTHKKTNTTNNHIVTSIEKIIKFIKEITCTDKLQSTFYSAFTLDKEFQSKESGEKDQFINNQKHIWEILSNLSLHTWHRFFNVETLELMINNKNINLEEELKNFYSSNSEEAKKDPNIIKDPKSNTASPKTQSTFNKSKSSCEKILEQFCDIKKPEQNFGIKLIHKTINNSNKKFMNGFCVVRLVWIYENIGIVYLSFFQTFISIRRKIVHKLIDDFHNYRGDCQISCSNRHLIFLLPAMQLETKRAFELNNFNTHNITELLKKERESGLFDSSQTCSIFTYRPYKKLVDSYTSKKHYKFTYANKFMMEKFILFLLNHRVKENFTFLNANTKGIIFVNKISVSKVKNFEEVENSKIIFKRCLILYIMQLSPNKEELSIELSVEPVSGYYMIKFSEKEAKIFDERNFFTSLSNYFKTIDKEIFESVKNFCVLMKETIIAKLMREPLLEIEDSTSQSKNTKKNSKFYNFFNYKNIKKDCTYNTYLCFASDELKKNQNKLIEKIEEYKKDLKEFCENILEEKVLKNKLLFNKNLKKSFELMKESEYKILEKCHSNSEITILEKIIIDRFYIFFFDLFNSIMDSNFEDEEKCTYYTKVISRTTLLIVRYPSIDKLFTCCKNQSVQFHELFMHIKYFFFSLDKQKQSEKNFAEILSEKSSLKTIELKDHTEYNSEVNNAKDIGEGRNEFWDNTGGDTNTGGSKSNQDQKGTESFDIYKKNEYFEMYPTQILNNILLLIEDFYKMIYHKNNMITYIENTEGDLDTILKNSTTYTVEFDLKEILDSSREKNSISCDFICIKLREILVEYFKPLTNNFYSNEKIFGQNDSESDTTNSITEESEKNAFYNTYDKVKDLFIIQLNFIHTVNGDVNIYPVQLNELEKFKDILKEIKNKETKYKNEAFMSKINLLVKIYFVPEIEDIYTEININEIREDNMHLTSVCLDNYSLYYYDYDNLSKMVPCYIEYHNQEYFISISKKQKHFIKNVYSSIVSLKNIIALESIRLNFNSSTTNSKLDYEYIHDMMMSINDSYFNVNKQNFKVVSKSEVLNYLDEEDNEFGVVLMRRNGSRFYMIDFENMNNKILNEFKKFLHDKSDAKLFLEDSSYKIPIWLMFYLTPIDKKSLSTGRYLIDDFKDDEISLDIKYLYLDYYVMPVNGSNCPNNNIHGGHNNLKREEILETITKLITFYIKIINKKILMNILKSKNFCDERLFPLEGTGNIKRENEESLNISAIAPNSIRQTGTKNEKNKIGIKNSISNPNLLNITTNSNKSPLPNNPCNNFTRKQYTQNSLKNDTFLDFQTSTRYYFDINIEEIYKLLIEDLKANFKISNRPDIFKVTYQLKDEVFILKVSLLNDDNKFDKRYSFADSFNTLFNFSNSNAHFSSTLKPKKSNYSVIDERLSTPGFSSKGLCILVEFYGLENPSQNVLKIVKDIVNEKALIVKVKHYTSLLSQMEEVKSSEDYKFLTKSGLRFIDNASKIKESIDNFFDKAKVSWSNLTSTTGKEITKLDIELISNFSDRIILESVNPAFESLKNMSMNFFENLADYFKLFKDNKIVQYKVNEDLKVLIVPEILNHAFLVKIENKKESSSQNENHLITYELLRRKEKSDSNEGQWDSHNLKQDVLQMIYKFLDDLLYVSYLLLVNYKSK